MKLQWKTPEQCNGLLIQIAEPREGLRFSLIRPQGKRSGDKWAAAVTTGTAYKRTRLLTDDAPQEKAKEACEDHWEAVRALDSQNDKIQP
jgi:hypothetical protein